jgi:hypothetical protein
MSKQFITNVVPNRTSIVYKSAKNGTKSFRITQQLLQSIITKSKKLKHVPALVIKIPANKNENYIVTCHVKKEKI